MKAYLLSFVFLFPCLSIAQNNAQHQKDSLRNLIPFSEGKEKLEAYRLLSSIYFNESVRDDLKMDTLLAIYEEYDAEALRQGVFTTQGLIRSNRLSAHANRNELDEVIKLAPGYLAYLSKHEVWKTYYSVYQLYLQARLRKGEYDKTIEGARQMYEEANKRNHDDGKGIALYMMSSVYGNMSRPQEEEQYMRECIEIIRNIDGILWLTTSAYFRLCGVLITTGRYDEAFQLVLEFEKANYRYEEASKSKQLSVWINLWNTYRRLYLKTGDYDRAEMYCNKLDSISRSPLLQYDILNTRAQILYHRKQYDQALEMVDKALEMSSGNPNRTDGSLGIKMMILSAMKGVKDIYELFEQAVTLRDSIRNTELNAQLDEIRTQYEVDKITAEKERMRQLLLFAFGACLLLALLLAIYIYYNRLIRRKNRGLYRQIKEQDRLAEELEKMKRLVAPQPESKADSKQQQLVVHLREYLLDKRNYAKSDINREELVSELITNRTYLLEAVKAETGKSLMEYINFLRLEEARRLLDGDPELTIETIAAECGFNSSRTFYRLFREQYQITPTEYRKLSGL